MKNLDEIKHKLSEKLNIFFDYPYYSKNFGEYGRNYLILKDYLIFSSEEKHVLKQIVQKIANALILKIYDPDDNIKLHQQEKNDLVYEDAFTFLFDQNFKWIVIQDAREDEFIFIGSELVKIVKEVVKNWDAIDRVP